MIQEEMGRFLQTVFWNRNGWNSEPEKNIHERRIECFKKLIENQKAVLAPDNQLFRVSSSEKGTHTNAEHRLSFYQKEYRDLYAKCEKDMKP